MYFSFISNISSWNGEICKANIFMLLILKGFAWSLDRVKWCYNDTFFEHICFIKKIDSILQSELKDFRRKSNQLFDHSTTLNETHCVNSSGYTECSCSMLMLLCITAFEIQICGLLDLWITPKKSHIMLPVCLKICHCLYWVIFDRPVSFTEDFLFHIVGHDYL